MKEEEKDAAQGVVAPAAVKQPTGGEQKPAAGGKEEGACIRRGKGSSAAQVGARVSPAWMLIRLAFASKSPNSGLYIAEASTAPLPERVGPPRLAWGHRSSFDLVHPGLACPALLAISNNILPLPRAPGLTRCR